MTESAISQNRYGKSITLKNRDRYLLSVIISIEKVGKWISKESEMGDLKAKHKTKMILEDVKFDSGLSNEMFTERYLTR